MSLSTSTPPDQAPKTEQRFSSSIRRYTKIGSLACVILVFGVGGWAATARLASAVISVGTVVVASNVRQVQHADGGIVGDIMIEDGQHVDEGDLLIQLDETLVAANRALLDGQIIALEARLARLEAERTDADTLPVPDELSERMDDPLVKQAMASETSMFEARNITIDGQVDRLNERTGQLEQQIVGLEAQYNAKLGEIELIDEELEVIEDLFAKGNTTRDRVVNLRRTKTRLDGEAGDFLSRIAVARGRITETELEVLALTTDRREDTFKEITEIKPELANLKERRVAADFQLDRMDIRAPASGRVFELTAFTEGGVIQPAETIMQIVPAADKLLIESQVLPTDVDQVAIGQEAVVVLSAFDYKSTPQLYGEVTFVSAEASRDQQTGFTYYSVRVRLNDGELDRLNEGLVLLPGMPAEVFISTGGQTVVSYLMRPLTEQFRRAWRES
ncbi:MAG: HlyD family type I secretion periplasmic adaptor subunit [Pseudomonadota bacterium]